MQFLVVNNQVSQLKFIIMNSLTRVINCSFAHSSRAWFKEHVNDQFVKKAALQNYRSRAAFKLQQIQAKFNILGKKVIDLGSAPGSWSQYAIRYKKKQGQENKTNIVSVDILDMKQIEGVDFYKCDARDRNLHKMFKEKYGYFDSIISDMAPNFSGVSFETHEQILGLNKMCVKLALQLSHENCSLVMKTTQGAHSKLFFQFLQLIFESAWRFKPKASRSESKQFYLVCKNFRKQYHSLSKTNETASELLQTKSQPQQKKAKTKSQKLIQFINTDFNQILLNSSAKKINKRQLQKILEQAVQK